MTLITAQVAATLNDLKAAAIANNTILYDQAPFKWTANSSIPADNVDVVASDDTEFWIRLSAAHIQADDGASVQDDLDHGGYFTPIMTGAVTRSTAGILSMIGIQAESLGAIGDAVTDDRDVLNVALGQESVTSLTMPNAYSVSAGPSNPNPELSDPQPSALTITKSDFVLDGLSTGAIICTAANKGILHLKNASEANRPHRTVIRNFRKLVQAYGNPESGGLQDDYFTIRTEGVEDCLFENIHIDQCELGFTDQFVQTSIYCNYYTFDAAADVSVADNTIIVNKDRTGAAATHDFVTGSKVAMTMSGGSAWSLAGATPPPGLTTPYRFYAIVVDAETIKLAASYDDAIAGTAIDIADVGAGTICIIRMARGSKRNILSNFTIAKCAYIGVQLAGCEFGSYTGISIAGQDADGTSRGGQHGVRSDGFFMSLTTYNCVVAAVSRMANGLSLQSWSEHNVFSIIADDCQNAVATTLPTDHVAAAKHNTINLTANRCNYGIYESGNSYNTYVVDILNPSVRGIFTTNGGGGEGMATGNVYRGRIRRTLAGSAARLVELNGPNTDVDLILEGSGSTSSDTSIGLLVQPTSTNIRGSVRVSNCQIGVLLNGIGGNVSVKSSGCGTDIVVAANASNLRIDCDCDGNVSIASGATSITLTGRVAGTVTDAGTGTDLSNLNLNSGITTATTDASGFIMIAHGLGRVPKNISLTTADNASRTFSITARTASTFTARVWSGPATPLASSSTSFSWVTN